MTKQLQKMLADRVGYRSDVLFGSPGRLRRALDILDYEYGELGNTDIAYTMQELGYIENPEYEEAYKYIKDLETKLGEELVGIWLTATVEDVLDYVPDEDYVDEEDDEDYADEEEEEETYAEFIMNNLDTRKIPDVAIPISDLGSQGVLWIFPRSLETDTW